MIGYPKYSIGDEVSFEFPFGGEMKTVTGKVFIVDKYGTFEQNEEPSYDVMAPDPRNGKEMCLFKHIRESRIVEVE